LVCAHQGSWIGSDFGKLNHCVESHLQITPNPTGSPHSVSQIPNADRQRGHRRHGEKRENANRINTHPTETYSDLLNEDDS